MKTSTQPKQSSLEQRAEELARYLIVLRNMQDKTSSAFLGSLGGLSMQELNILNVIGDHEPCIMSDIAKASSLSLSSVTVIMDKLVKAKLAKRIRNEDDRRVVHGGLTEEGRKVYQVQIKHMHDILSKMLNLLTVDEQESFLKIFQKITRAWA